MSFEMSDSIESHERIKLILIFADKSLLLKWWVTYVLIGLIKGSCAVVGPKLNQEVIGLMYQAKLGKSEGTDNCPTMTAVNRVNASPETTTKCTQMQKQDSVLLLFTLKVLFGRILSYFYLSSNCGKYFYFHLSILSSLYFYFYFYLKVRLPDTFNNTVQFQFVKESTRRIHRIWYYKHRILNRSENILKGGSSGRIRRPTLANEVFHWRRSQSLVNCWTPSQFRVVCCSKRTTCRKIRILIGVWLFISNNLIQKNSK